MRWVGFLAYGSKTDPTEVGVIGGWNPVPMSPDASVAPVAARQHGLVTLDQALASGLSRAAIDGRLSSGRWQRVRSRVFVVCGAPRTWEQSVLAAVLAAGPDAVASHTTAAALWEFPNVFRETLEVSTARPRRARHRGIRIHRTAHFLRLEHTVHHDVPVTSPARTLVDLSGWMSVVQLGLATDYARRELQMRLDDLQRCVVGLPPAPGRRPTRVQAVLRARLERHDESESGLEMRVLRAIVGAGLLEPVQQYWVHVGGRRRRIDLAYPDVKLAIEVDGWGTHNSRSSFDGDRARENDLDVAGWDRLHFTSSFSDRQIAETVTRKLAALGRKSSAGLEK